MHQNIYKIFKKLKLFSFVKNLSQKNIIEYSIFIDYVSFIMINDIVEMMIFMIIFFCANQFFLFRRFFDFLFFFYITMS